MTPSAPRLVFAAALASATLAAAPPAFRVERTVTPGGKGGNRLAVDVPLLAGAEPPAEGSERLSDLRLHDANGTEVPYLLVEPPRTEPAWVPGRVLPVSATKTASGFEVDLGRTRAVDQLRLLGLPAPFLKRVRLEASGDRARWTLLADEGTLFDLPAEGLERTVLDFPAGELRYLRVTWDDAASGRVPLPARAEVRLVAGALAPPPLRAPLPFEKRGGGPGVSRYRVRLPAPRLPIAALEVVLEAGNALRPAHVTESRLSGSELVPATLGASVLRRADRGALRAEDVRVPIGVPETAELELVVEDGSNPPLPIREVAALFRPLPWIYFESRDGAPLTARYGARGLAAPRYDLEAVRAAVTRGEPPAPVEAAWGAARVPVGGGEPAMPDEVVGAGAPVDVSAFRHRRPLPEGPEGLVALALDAAVLSGSRDLSDLRVVDASGRQVPYLLEGVGERLLLPLPPLEKVADPRPRPEARLTVYRVLLPFPDLPDARLAFRAGVRVFRRDVELFAERLPRASDRAEPSASFDTLARATWASSDPDAVPPPLALAAPRTGRTELFLAVDDGDNSPLPLVSPELSLPGKRLRFRRPAGAGLSLVYGSATVSPPRYDLALLAPRLLAAPAVEISLPPPHGTAGDGGGPFAGRARWVFWGALGAAALVLLALLSRLVARPA